VIGVLLAINNTTQYPLHQLKPVIAAVESRPAFTPELLALCLWAADYYQSPPGEALHTALPALLRQGEVAQVRGETLYRLSTHGKGLPDGALKRAPKQAALLAVLQEREFLSRADLDVLAIARTHLKT